MSETITYVPEPPEDQGETGRRSSRALTEARTVLSRAETALHNIRTATWPDPRVDPRDTETCYQHHYGDDGKRTGTTVHHWRDPDADAIEAALKQAIALLQPFARTGRARPSERIEVDLP